MNNAHHSRIVEALNKITGLESPTVPVEESDEVSLDTRSHLRFSYGVLTPEEDAPSEEEMNEEEREQSANNQEVPNIIDLMGAYFSDGDDPEKSRIVLYTEVIWLVARKLGVPYCVLKEKVLIHETAHAVTHLGKDSHGRVWDNFSAATVEDKEYFAQIYTHVLFRDAENGDEMEGYLWQMTGKNYKKWSRELYPVEEYSKTMVTLAEVQPLQYKTWIPDKNKSNAEINQMLEQAREKSRIS